MRRSVPLLVAVFLCLPGVVAAESQFADALPAPRLTLDGLPGESALPAAASPTPDALAAASPAPDPAAGTVDRTSLAPYVAPKRSFGFAAGEVLLLEVLPWSVNRYLNKSQFASISMATVRHNFETGFTYDRDNFKTDQSSHPYHGGLFFNAARTNGYSFWESGAFAFFGSFLWETSMESEPPAINDLVNTTLGGMDRGEIMYRLSRALLDNTARGGSRFWRELGAAAINPIGSFNRLLRGELNAKYENPSDRLPSRMVTDFEGFYSSRTGAIVGDENNGQGGLEIRLRYSDPFDGDHHKPYDWFEVKADLTYPASVLLSRAESRGVLFDGTLGCDGKTKQRLALLLHFTYYDNSPIAYGAESFDLDHMLLLPIGHDAELRTEAGISGAPMAALQVDYTDASMTVFGRSFDYGPAGGVHASAKIRRHEIDLLKISYGVLWHSTLDGLARHSTVQNFGVEGRAPLFGDRLSAGAGWNWISRLTTYVSPIPTISKSGSAVRLFAAVTFR